MKTFQYVLSLVFVAAVSLSASKGPLTQLVSKDKEVTNSKVHAQLITAQQQKLQQKVIACGECRPVCGCRSDKTSK